MSISGWKLIKTIYYLSNALPKLRQMDYLNRRVHTFVLISKCSMKKFIYTFIFLVWKLGIVTSFPALISDLLKNTCVNKETDLRWDNYFCH